MTIPKEIVEKMEQVNALMLEIDKWLYDNTDVEGTNFRFEDYLTSEFRHEDIYEFTDKPCGQEQNEGEYCSQSTMEETGKAFYGKHFYPTEKGNYFCFEYWI